MNKLDQNLKLLRLDQVVEIIPMGKSTIWMKVADGTFPSPIKISDNVVAWKLSDIQEWLEAKNNDTK